MERAVFRESPKNALRALLGKLAEQVDAKPIETTHLIDRITSLIREIGSESEWEHTNEAIDIGGRLTIENPGSPVDSLIDSTLEIVEQLVGSVITAIAVRQGHQRASTVLTSGLFVRRLVLEAFQGPVDSLESMMEELENEDDQEKLTKLSEALGNAIQSLTETMGQLAEAGSTFTVGSDPFTSPVTKWMNVISCCMSNISSAIYIMGLASELASVEGAAAPHERSN